MSRSARALPLLALLLLVTGAGPLAAGQETPERAIEEDETWEDGTVFRDETIVVRENVTVTVRGARVTLDNVTLRVEVNATLRLESLPGRPAEIHGGEQGWQGRIFGALRVAGTPADPVVLDGLNGTSGFSGATVLATGGLAFPKGTLEARHLVVRNYTTGLLVNTGSANVDHVRFHGGLGSGLILSTMPVTVSNATFEGAGGSMIVTISSDARLRNLTFRDVDNALTLRGSTVDLEGYRGANTSTCMVLVALTEVNARDVECADFRSVAVATQPLQTLRAGVANLTLTNFRAWTNETVQAVVVGQNANMIRLRDSEIGPAGGAGLVLTASGVAFEDVRFRGLSHYAVVHIDPPANQTFAVPGEGEPGKDGWVRVVQRSPFRIVDADGRSVNGTRIDLRAEDTDVLVFSNTSLEDAYVAPALESLVIDRRGSVREVTFRVEAGNATAGAVLEGYAPKPQVTELVLIAGRTPEFKSNTPGPGLALVLLALVALALARRR